MIKVKNKYPIFTIDIEAYENFGPGNWAQEQFLIHGLDDVYWTSSIEDVLSIIERNLKNIKENK